MIKGKNKKKHIYYLKKEKEIKETNYNRILEETHNFLII